MLFYKIFKIAVKSLFSNKIRSFLAILGIIIGVGAVISMLAIGKGAKQSVIDRISSMGKNLLVIRAGQKHMRGVSSGNGENLTLDDAKKIVEKISEVKMVSPVVRGSVQLKYFNKNTRTSVIGGAVTYFSISNFTLDKGRLFTEREAEHLYKVAVLGETVVQNLFDKEYPIGKFIKVKGINFKVIGTLKSKGDQGWSNPDDQIIIPYTTAMNIVLGITKLKEIDVYVKDGISSTIAENKISKLLRKNHKIVNGKPDDFRIRNQTEILQTASKVTGTFTILLGSIACISLLVGGIGIMNIMIVTVTERTREIGIRKSIGAKDLYILLQFLIESILMSSIGGIVGIFLGISVSKIITSFSSFQAIVSYYSIVLSFSFSVSVGVFFGFYPAYKASKLNPIDALRYE